MNVRVVKLTTVQWPMDGELKMFSVVGEQHRLDSVVKALKSQLASPSSKPHTAVLVQQSDNPHDSQAVAVYFRGSDSRHHVGFLPRAEARVFREQMLLAGWGSVELAVLACITEPEDASHPQVSIYLPTTFGELCFAGYHLDPGNCPSWLKKSSSVSKRPGYSYSDDELRKIYCQYAQTRKWRALPDAVEARVMAWREQGLGPVGLALKFHEDGGAVLTKPKNAAAPAHSDPRVILSSNLPDVSVSLQRTVGLDAVLAWGPDDEWAPTRRIDISFIQAVTSLDNGQALLPESYFEFRSTNEKGRLLAPIKVPGDQMYVAFTKLWDTTLAVLRQASREGTSTRLVSINASKDCTIGCSVRPNGVVSGIFWSKRQRLEIPDFWLREFIYLLAKAFRFMQVETECTPDRWVQYTNHEPHWHGGQIKI